jgi:hypothetical protein
MIPAEVVRALKASGKMGQSGEKAAWASDQWVGHLWKAWDNSQEFQAESADLETEHKAEQAELARRHKRERLALVVKWERRQLRAQAMGDLLDELAKELLDGAAESEEGE